MRDLLSHLSLPAVWTAVWPAIAIALLRVGDVTLNVFRVGFVVQERRLLAGPVAGAEAGLWLAAAGIVFADMTPVRSFGLVLAIARTVAPAAFAAIGESPHPAPAASVTAGRV